MVDSSRLEAWGLIGLIEREVVRDRLLDVAIPLTEEQRQQALRIYLDHRGIQTESELSRWVLAEGLDQAQLQCRAERFLAWLLLCEQRFRHQMLSLFLKRKAQLDRAVYCLHWVEDEALAHELFLRLKERECSFEQLFCALPEGREQGLPSGKHGPVALESLPEALSQMLRVSEPGQVWPPREAESGWVIVQLQELQPAVFDQGLKQQFALELGDRWLQECMDVERKKDVD